MKNVTIVGVGALGSHLSLLLRNEAVRLKVIDFDRVESKNTPSQFHPKTTNGKLKVDSLKQTLNFLFGTKIETNSNKLVAENVNALLKDSDLIVDCLDNLASRKLVQEYVRKNSIPCLHGALAPNGEFGRVCWDPQFVIDDETGMGGVTCENGEFLPFIVLVSSYLARSVQIFLKEGKQVGFQVQPFGAVAV